MKYKVGDKVRIKSIDWYKNNRDLYGHIVFSREDEEDVEFNSLHADYCGQIMTIRSIVYGSRYIMEDDIHESEWTDEMIEGLVEEEVGLVDNLSSRWVNEFNLPEGYIFKDEEGNVINATKIVLEKKKKEYPKTYEECCEIMQVARHTIWFDYDDVSSISKEGDEYECHIENTLCAFRKLLICRDAYWQIAGEEMRLGKPWEPDWTNDNAKYSIYTIKGVLTKAISCYDGAIFVFPTEEMRDAFKKNFDPDIEICKEFL